MVQAAELKFNTAIEMSIPRLVFLLKCRGGL